MIPEMPDSLSYTCPNCNADNSPDIVFCSTCGQKKKPLRITFYDFIKDFMDVVFNLDNKFWKTFRVLFIPAKLTKIFFLGKRKSFYHPLRLYLVAVIFLFTIISILKIDGIVDFGENAELKQRYQKKELVYRQATAINKTLDSLKTEYSDEQSASMIDSVTKSLFLVNGQDTTYVTSSRSQDTLDSADISLLITRVKFSMDELYLEDIDEVLDKKNVENYFERLIYKQLMKSMRDINSFNAYIFANLTWLFLAIIPVFSLILKIFYIRRKRYYMEHFVFLLHLFTALIFLLGIMMITMIPLDGKVYFGIFAGILVSLYPYIAFKRYYGQGIMKTFIKFLGIGFFFFIAFLATFIIFMVITAALF